MAIEKEIENIVNSFGAKVYDIELVNENGNNIYRIYIVRDGGVDLDLCADISNAVSPLLDIEPPTNESYYLEVSSPGLERSLKKPKHFQNSIGEKVKVNYSEGKIKGELVSADDKKVTIKSKEGEKEIEYDDIKKARTYINWK